MFSKIHGNGLLSVHFFKGIEHMCGPCKTYPLAQEMFAKGNIKGLPLTFLWSSTLAPIVLTTWDSCGLSHGSGSEEFPAHRIVVAAYQHLWKCHPLECLCLVMGGGNGV